MIDQDPTGANVKNDGDELQQLNIRLPRRTIRLAQRIARKEEITVATLTNRLLLNHIKEQATELQTELDRQRLEAERQEQLLARDLRDALHLSDAN